MAEQYSQIKQNDLSNIQHQEELSIHQDDSQEQDSLEINPKDSRFPFCIVWTSLPIITWLIPFIGHTGICTSNGIIHDFAGPYFVSVNDFAFGKPYKYVKLNQGSISKSEWDQAINASDRIYEKTLHNICCNNCHHHVATALNKLSYNGKQNWTMLDVWWMCLTKGKYVSPGYCVANYLTLSIIVIIILVVIFH